MIIATSGRQSGKTRWALNNVRNNPGGYMLVAHEATARMLRRQNPDIADRIVSAADYPLGRAAGVYVDDVDRVLAALLRCTVLGATATASHVALSQGRLSHGNDPDTSAAAVPRRGAREAVKEAVLTILREVGPSTVPGVTDEYFRRFVISGSYPLVQRHSIARRMSELHKAGRVADSGERETGPSGRLVAVWQAV